MTSLGSDLDLESLRPILGRHVVGYPLLHYDTLDSTMDEASRLAEAGGREGTVVVADEQTDGRGRLDRQWVSPKGQNLTLSAILTPTVEQLPYMNMAATLSVSRAISDATDLEPTIKWPNDVRINGRKLAGILIESALTAGRVRYTIVGIGLNINFDPSQFPDISEIATSISKETGRKENRTKVLKLLLEHLDELYREIKLGRTLTQDWAAQLDTLGHHVQISWGDHTVEGLAQDVDERGNLILVLADGTTHTALAGEVTLQV